MPDNVGVEHEGFVLCQFVTFGPDNRKVLTGCEILRAPAFCGPIDGDFDLGIESQLNKADGIAIEDWVKELEFLAREDSKFLLFRLQ